MDSINTTYFLSFLVLKKKSVHILQNTARRELS